MHINKLFLLVQKSVTKILQIHYDKYHNLWLMQIVKMIDIESETLLPNYTYQYVHISSLIYYEYSFIHLFYILIPILTVAFSVLSSFRHCVFISMRRLLGLLKI